MGIIKTKIPISHKISSDVLFIDVLKIKRNILNIRIPDQIIDVIFAIIFIIIFICLFLGYLTQP